MVKCVKRHLYKSKDTIAILDMSMYSNGKECEKTLIQDKRRYNHTKDMTMYSNGKDRENTPIQDTLCHVAILAVALETRLSTNIMHFAC